MRRLMIPAVAGLVVGLAGCGGGSSTGGEARIPAGVAAELAARSEMVAGLVAAGDSCGARKEALALAGAVRRAVDTGTLSLIVAREVKPAVAELIDGIVCEPPASPEPTATTEADEDQDQPEEAPGKSQKNKKDKDKEKKHGKQGAGNGG